MKNKDLELKIRQILERCVFVTCNNQFSQVAYDNAIDTAQKELLEIIKNERDLS